MAQVQLSGATYEHGVGVAVNMLKDYEVRLTDDHWDELLRWDDHLVDALMAFIRDHASRTPTTRIPGKLKQLQGAFRGYYQFRVDRQRRFIYRVDEERRRVIAAYVGPHPDWRKSHGQGRITR